MKLGHRLRREVLRVPRQVDRMSVASAVHTSGLTLLRSSNLVESPFISHGAGESSHDTHKHESSDYFTYALKTSSPARQGAMGINSGRRKWPVGDWV